MLREKRNPLKLNRSIDITRILTLGISSISAFQYTNDNSLIHRLNPLLKIGIWMVLTTLCLLLTEIREMFALTLISIFYFLLTRPSLKGLVRDMRFILMMSLSIILVCLLLDHDRYRALNTGIAMSLRVMILFIPMMVFIKTTSFSQMLRGSRKLIPYRYSFAFITAFRFLPYFLRELINIIEVQRMRGLKLNWATFFSKKGLTSVLIPLTVRGIRTADELSRSVISRAFGITRKRTYLEDVKKAFEEKAKRSVIRIPAVKEKEVAVNGPNGLENDSKKWVKSES